MQGEVDSQSGGQNTHHANDEILYTVRPRDTLYGIALAFYGNAEQEDRIFQANLGRLQPHGRQLNRHGLILPGWTLAVPEPTRGVVEQTDGKRWYVVKRGDTMGGIAADLLGDEERYRELFDLNVGQASVGDRGPVLERPDLIWPGLRLQLPDEVPAAEAPSSLLSEPQIAAPPEATEPAASPTPTASPARAAAAPKRHRRRPHCSSQIVATQTEVVVPRPPAASSPLVPVAAVGSDTGRRCVSPEKAALLGGRLAGAIAAGALVLRRGRRAPTPTGLKWT